MKYRIRVRDIGPGVFSTERSATLDVGGQSYTLIVPTGYLDGETLRVEGIAERGDQILVDLPRETFTSGSRILVPREALLPA
jgi:hypothetical protein